MAVRSGCLTLGGKISAFGPNTWGKRKMAHTLSVAVIPTSLKIDFCILYDLFVAGTRKPRLAHRYCRRRSNTSLVRPLMIFLLKSFNVSVKTRWMNIVRPCILSRKSTHGKTSVIPGSRTNNLSHSPVCRMHLRDGLNPHRFSFSVAAEACAPPDCAIR